LLIADQAFNAGADHAPFGDASLRLTSFRLDVDVRKIELRRRDRRCRAFDTSSPTEIKQRSIICNLRQPANALTASIS
jgi:hypothetical protein